jgi:hypothetical protein
MIGYEAQCQKCGEIFNPADENDLEHGMRDDEQECGGQGVLLGGWTSPPHPGDNPMTQKRWHADVLVYSTDTDNLRSLAEMADVIEVAQLTDEGLGVTFLGPDDWNAAYDALLLKTRAAYGSQTEISDLQEA